MFAVAFNIRVFSLVLIAFYNVLLINYFTSVHIHIWSHSLAHPHHLLYE